MRVHSVLVEYRDFQNDFLQVSIAIATSRDDVHRDRGGERRVLLYALGLQLVQFASQGSSLPHQFLIFMLLHLQFPLAFDADGVDDLTGSCW